MTCRRLSLFLPLCAALLWWTAHLQYNGPMIDEAFYAQAAKIGNVFYLTGDARLWPVVSAAAHAVGGLAAARGCAAVCAVVAAGLLAWLVSRVLREQAGTSSVAPACVVLFFFAIAPTHLIATMATYDALALALHGAGVALLYHGIARRSAVGVWGAVALLVLGAATRYFYWGPGGLLLLLGGAWSWRQGTLRWYLRHAGAACGLLAGGYFLLNGAHVMAAIRHGSRDAVALGGRETREDILRALWALLGGWGVFSVWGTAVWCRWEARHHGWILPAGFFLMALSPVGYHLWSGHDLSMERDLAVTAWYGAPAAAVGVAALFGGLRWRWWAAIGCGLVGLWSGWHAVQVAHAYQDWPDWRPVAAALRRYPIDDRHPVWVIGHNRAFAWIRLHEVPDDGNVWYLRQTFGVAVDTASPWVFDTVAGEFSAAAEERIDYLVGTLPGATPPVGTILWHYRVLDIIDVPYGRPVSILRYELVEHPD